MTGNSGFKGMVNSINPNFYREIARQSFGRSLLYLLLLVLIVSLVLSAKLAVDLRREIARFSGWTVQHLPEIIPPGLSEMTLEDGRVTSPVAQPFVFERQDFAFVLDTTGKIVSLDGYKNGILITKDKVIFKAAEGGRTKVEEYDLSKVKISPFIVKSGDAQRGELLHLTIGKKILSITKNSIDKAGNVISLLVFAIMVLFMFGLFLNTKLFQIFIFSLVSLIINSLSSGRLKYVYLLNIGTYAITVPTVVSVFLILFPVTGKQTLLKLWPLFYILLYLVFLYLAIVRCKQAEESQAA